MCICSCAWFAFTKYSSFQRQLNIYGFIRIKSGADIKAYYHKHFIRGHEYLLHNIIRVPLKKDRAVPSSASPEPDFNAIITHPTTITHYSSHLSQPNPIDAVNASTYTNTSTNTGISTEGRNNANLLIEAMSHANHPLHHQFQTLTTQADSVPLERHSVNNETAAVNYSNHADLLRSIHHLTGGNESTQGFDAVINQYERDRLLRQLLLVGTPSSASQHLLLPRLQQEALVSSNIGRNTLLQLQQLQSLPTVSPAVVSHLERNNDPIRFLVTLLADQANVSRQNQLSSIIDWNRVISNSMVPVLAEPSTNSQLLQQFLMSNSSSVDTSTLLPQRLQLRGQSNLGIDTPSTTNAGNIVASSSSDDVVVLQQLAMLLNSATTQPQSSPPR
jgi:HSF-type DNA-binding